MVSPTALAVFMALSVAQGGDAHAQASADDSPAGRSASGVEIEEVVVTAQRRAQNVQQVPISVEVLNDESLERQGVRSVVDVARLTPGLSFNSGGDRALSTIAIRGVESSGGASTTGLYLDDIPIQARRVGYGGGSPYPRIFDLSRVEVLRGPQGTLFGAGSEGGTVRFITTPPSLDSYSGYARAELATTEHGAESYEGGVAFGGPLSDRVGFRLSAWHRREGGFVDRVDFRNGDVVDRDANARRSTVLSAALRLAPTDSIEILPAIFYQKENSRDVGSFWSELSDPGAGAFRSGNVLRAPSRDRFAIPSLTLRVDAGGMEVVSVTSYLDRRNVIVADYTEAARAALFGNPYPPPGVVGPNTFTNSQKSWSQELRLQSTGEGRARWVLGFFWQRSKQNSTQYDDDPSLDGEFFALTGLTLQQILGQAPIDGRYIYVQDPYRGKDTQVAGFGQLDFNVTDAFTATVGLRVARTKFNTTTTVSGPFGGIPFTDGGRQSETPITPKFAMQYRFDADKSVYASASKGFRVGGYNPRQLSICQAQLDALGLGNGSSSYDSDSVWSYEIGSKNQLLDRRLTVNGSAYYIKWSDIQQFVNLASCLGGFIANLGKATSKGFDVQWQFAATDRLSLGGSVGYTHGSYDQTTGISGVTAVSDGDRLPGPPWKVALSAEYELPSVGTFRPYLRGDYQYASAEPDRLAPNNPVNGLNFVPGYYTRPATDFVSLRAGLRGEHLEVSMFVDNLFDDGTVTERIAMPITITPFRASAFRPRSIGLTASYRY